MIKYANHFQTVITNAAGLPASSTSMTVQSVDGLPTLGAGDWFRLVLIKLATNARECIKVTAVSGKTLTIQRAQEGTTALDFARYDAVELWITKGVLDDVIAERDTEAYNTANDALALAQSARDTASTAAFTAVSAQNNAADAQTTANAAQATANAALPVAGGTVTGPVTFSGAVSFNGNVSGSGADRVGDIVMRLAPVGRMLLCDGSTYDAISQPDYNNLFNQLVALDASGVSTTEKFVVNESSKTFRVPDLRGLVPVMHTSVASDETGTYIFKPFEKTGEYKHSLLANEGPVHSHDVPLPKIVEKRTSGTDTNLQMATQGYPIKEATNKSTGQSGTAAGHNNVQPCFPLFFYITY